MVPKRVVVLTNSEFGAANVMLGTIHSLLQLDPTLLIHVVSFSPIAQAVAAASDFAQKCSAAATHPVTFHQIEGLSLTQALLRFQPQLWQLMGQRPGFWTGLAWARRIGWFFLPWDAVQYIKLYPQAEEAVRKINPDLALVDPMFGLGLTVCERLGISQVHILPNTLKDVAGGAQPRGEMFWKYPMYVRFPFPKLREVRKLEPYINGD